MAKYCGVISGYYIRQYTSKNGTVTQHGGEWHSEKDVYGDTWAEIEEQASEYAKEDRAKKEVHVHEERAFGVICGGFNVSPTGKVYDCYKEY